jgi:hypothetical protein
MAELDTLATERSSCCSTAAQEDCCEPEAKDECCGAGHAEGCGCRAGKQDAVDDVHDHR